MMPRHKIRPVCVQTIMLCTDVYISWEGAFNLTDVPKTALIPHQANSRVPPPTSLPPL
jgi:hypothetical protein